MTDLSRASSAAAQTTVLRGGGEMGALMRAMDWDRTALGPVDIWSTSLRTTVSTLLPSRHAMFLWWGPDLIQFYNDAYRQSLGPDRHPSALGQRGRECWAEIWPTIGPEVESIMAGGESTWHEDHLVPITRGDRVYDAYWSYSYSPVQDDDGSVGGVLVTVQETTRRVVGERRMRLLQELGTRMQHAGSVEEVCSAAATSLRKGPHDVALALLYLVDVEARALRLAVSVGREPGAPTVLPELPLSASIETIMRDLWPGPVGGALTLPLATALPNSQAHGVVLVGLNPRLPLDRAYSHFVEQAAREIATALDRVREETQERQSALAAAHAERALLERVFDLSPAFLAVLRGPRHVFELANPAFFQVVGHRPILGREVLDALPEVAGQGFLELLDGVYRTGEPFVGNELPVQLQILPGGALEERHVNFVYQPLRDAGGAVTGILASGVDVTPLVAAREAAERARLEAEKVAAERDIERRQLLTVLDQAPLGIVITEAPTGRFLFLNSKVAELFGVTPALNAGSEYSADYRGFHPGGGAIQPHEWPMSRALQGEAVWNEIFEIERGTTGQRLEMSVNAAPVRDAQGRIIAGVAMFWDVTEERRIERQLRDVQRIQAVGTLAGGVAHEINNQMTAVVGFGGFVLRALGPDHSQASDMRRVLEAGRRAARVSQQLLAFTRQQVTQPRLLDLQEVVRELEPVLQHLLGADKLLTITAAAGPKVSADPDQVQQVLVNLIANARDATETGAEVWIVVEDTIVEAEMPAPLGEPVAPGNYVRLSIIDTGAGMTAETLGHIFDPFFTTKAVGKGTGLGLPMVYGTMRRHGGYVVARSGLGAGTTMELYWPVTAETETPAGDGEAEDPRQSYAAGGGVVILVAEDEDAVRALAVRALEEEGYRVLEAADGVEALEAFERAVLPEIVVTDVIMPRLNGRQLSEAVWARWPDVRVLFMSGHTGQSDVLERLVPAGAPFLQKPFTPEGLAQAVGVLRAQPGMNHAPQ